MVEQIDRDELRSLVRDVLRSALREQTGKVAVTPPGTLVERIRAAVLPGGDGRVLVEDDLAGFARGIIAAAAHEDLKAAIMSGRVAFVRDETEATARRPAENPVGAGPGFRISDGILNEMRVAEIGRQHRRLVIGPEVVVTPLARDRARELKLELVRAKS